jgi:shikimate dehydrogenase
LEQVFISSRNAQRQKELQADFGVQAVPWEDRERVSAQLLVNATPLGMSGPEQEQSPLPARALQGFSWVYDLVYNPLQTSLLQQARAAGCETISGLEMFLHQAQAQFRLWSGREFNIDHARKLLCQALQQASS